MYIGNSNGAFDPRSGLRGVNRRSGLNGLGTFIDEVIRDVGGLLPGQQITFEQAKYVSTGGESLRNPAAYAYLTPDFIEATMAQTYGGYQGFLDHWQGQMLRLTALQEADEAYRRYQAARGAAAPAAAEILVFDATGRATDESVAASNAYINNASAREAQAVDNAINNMHSITQVLINEQVASAPRVYTDAELGPITRQALQNGQLPGQVVTVLVNQYNATNDRAVSIVNREFAILQAEDAAVAEKAERDRAAAAAAAAATAAATATATTAVMPRESGRAAIVFPADFTSRTGAQKVEYYRTLIRGGYTDAEIRAAAESSFGRQTDADWNWLRQAAAASPAVTAPGEGGAGVPPVRVVRPGEGGAGTPPVRPTGTGTGTDTGGGVGLLIAAAAAYFLLG